MPSFKKFRDFEKGKEDRRQVANYVNTYLKSVHSELRLEWPKERGLDYAFVNNKRKRKWFGFIRFSNDSQVYIKLRQCEMEDVESAIESFGEYWMLFVYRPDGILRHKYAGPCLVRDLVKTYGWHMRESTGNKNRLCIRVNPATLIYKDLYTVPVGILDEVTLPMSERLRVMFNENILSNVAVRARAGECSDQC